MGTSTSARIRAADRKLQIMDVARELFARQGFDGTTTRQIAERAKVNEAIIFRHFPSKQDLYWAVIEQQIEAGGAHHALESRLNSGAGDREIFCGIAEDTLRRRAQDSGLSRLLLYSALENHKLSYRFFQSHGAAYYEALADYIRRRIEAGAFRKVDPLLAARAFLGMVIYHSLVQDLFGGKRFQDFDVHQVSQTITDIWLGGMQVPASSPRQAPTSTKKD